MDVADECFDTGGVGVDPVEAVGQDARLEVADVGVRVGLASHDARVDERLVGDGEVRGTGACAHFGDGGAQGARAQDENAFAPQPGRGGGVVAADRDLGAGLVDAHPPGGQTVEPLGAELDDRVAEFGQLRAAAEGSVGGQAPDPVGEVGQVPGHQVGLARPVTGDAPRGGAQQQVHRRGRGVLLVGRRVAAGVEQGAVMVRDDSRQPQQQAWREVVAGQGIDQFPRGERVFERQVLRGDDGGGEKRVGVGRERGALPQLLRACGPGVLDGEPAHHVASRLVDLVQYGGA
ncbi:hypothetical protein GCM10010365_74810 [Streptomyces poonensis]|uniref:Uncharacterized protein n=1 Tax=Streptomyces poonensis TaxID=68255 RepID=A0A918UYH1_9ACTN|nr:hypothetical protein GCM10010365_74810 [Streptomyces poonensis]